MADKIFTLLAWLWYLLGAFCLSVYIWLNIPNTNAFFSADSITFSAPLTTLWSITYYTWATANNVRTTRSWAIIYTTLNLWSWQSSNIIITSVTSQQASNVFAERAYLANCTVSSYSSITRVSWWIICPVWRIFSDTWSTISATGSTGETGATGATGATGSTGATGADSTIPWPAWSQGNDGLNAFELAQVVEWYTGDVYQWLDSLRGSNGSTGATGSLSLDLSQSGTISLSTVVQLPENDSTLSSSWLYFTLLSQKDGDILVNWEGARNLSILFVLFFLIIFTIFKFVRKEEKLI